MPDRAPDSLAPPGPTTIEISLFGPGYGESMAVHLGLGEWLVVDSCVTGDKKMPAALRYLSDIGVDAAMAVKLVVATHWHDDHIRGMATLFRACTAARFACSAALRHEDFFTLAMAADRHCMMETSGVGEFLGVLRELERRKTAPRWATENRTLLARGGELPGHVEALSPSDPAVTRALQSIGQLSGDGALPKRRLAAPERNEGAVVLMVAVGSTRLLLGADLLDARAPDRGWNAVIAATRQDRRPAQVYKVAHHGAASADPPRIWSESLVDQPVAILTPFVRGKQAIPTSRDIRRLREHTARLYATARSADERMEFERGPVGRTKREVLRSGRKIMMSPGHVRVRLNQDAAGGRVDLFDGAVALGTERAGELAASPF